MNKDHSSNPLVFIQKLLYLDRQSHLQPLPRIVGLEDLDLSDVCDGLKPENDLSQARNNGAR